MKYSFSIEIPVVRPSTRGSDQLLTDSARLTEKYGKSNIVAGIDHDGSIMLSPEFLTDAEWKVNIKEGRWDAKGWNYDPGTTAQVYLRRGGVGAYYLGQVVFMKRGEELGFQAIAGNSYVLDYYRAMKELGIYIP